MKSKIVAVAVLALSGSVLTTTVPTFAQSDRACLQNNRIWSWRVINERTLLVTDRNYRPFLVRLGGGCVGLTGANMQLAFRTWTNLGCLRRGDEVRFVAPALGRMSCFVQDVQPYGYGPYAGDDRPYRGPYNRPYSSRVY